MENKSTNQPSIAARLILVAIGLGALYWILESVIDVLIFHEGNLVERLLTPDPNEIWMRSLVACILTIFSMYAQVIITERKRAQEGQRKALAEALQATHALGESEARYRSLVESAHDMIQKALRLMAVSYL